MSYSGFQENYNNPFSKIGEGIANAENSASGMISKFRNNRLVSGTGEFLNSNSLVAKVCFLFLIVILFIIAIRLGSRMITWFMSPSKNPILVDGLRDGQRYKEISQNPDDRNSIPILRSVNEREGIEFTWSVWLFVKDTTWDVTRTPELPTTTASTPTRLKHIFNKGSGSNISGKSKFKDFSLDGLSFPNNGPGVYLDGDTNDIIIFMNTYSSVIEKVRVPNIPLNKWVNVIIRCKGKNMDTYMNGTIKNRHVFKSPPKQNYGNIYVTKNNGFSGNLSALRYFDKALTGIEIENLIAKGPNLTADDSLKIFPPYFSLRWFFRKEQSN